MLLGEVKRFLVQVNIAQDLVTEPFMLIQGDSFLCKFKGAIQQGLG